MHYKSVGIRFVATLIDLIVLAVVGNVLSIAVGPSTGFGIVKLQGGMGLLFPVICLGYFVLMEAYCNGQTLGKMATKIRVVQENGKPCDLGTAIVRNILRIVDGFFFYLIGAILIWSSPKKQRLGDMAAHTVVVDSTKNL